MGQRKKMDVFVEELDADPAARAAEDEASRARLARYVAMGAAEAVAAEQEWRDELGLSVIEVLGSPTEPDAGHHESC